MVTIHRARLRKFALLVLVALVATVGGREGGVDPGEADDGLAALRAYSLELVNTARRENGLRQLVPGAALNRAAQSHAEDLLRRGYHAHVSPEGETVSDRYAAAGGPPYSLIAENVARCTGCTKPPDRETVETLHTGWMNSPEHRRNILLQGLTHYGFGFARDGQGTFNAVQTFAGVREVPTGGSR